MGNVWGLSDAPGDWMRKISVTPHTTTGRLAVGVRSAVQELTRREREARLRRTQQPRDRHAVVPLGADGGSHIYQARTKVDAGSRGELGALVARVSEGSRGT